MEVAKGGTRINHLLFLDDCVLFNKTTKEKWTKIQEILSVYEKWSSLVLSKEKSSILFSQNTKIQGKESIIQATRSIICSTYKKYLGLPAMVWRSKYNTFRNIKEKGLEDNYELKELFVISSEKGDSRQSSHPSLTYLHYKCIRLLEAYAMKFPLCWPTFDGALRNKLK